MPLRFVNPNYHVILIHYPLGVFVLGVFLELFGFMWRRSSVRTAARWMIVLGALLTLPAAVSGIYALADVRKNQTITPDRYIMLRLHVIYMGIASLLAVACAVTGIGSSDAWRQRLRYPLLLGVLVAWGLMVVGAWHGGETIYQQGTSVALINNEKDGTPVINDLSGQPTIKTTSLKNYDDVATYYIGGELQQHLIVAGFAFAAAMGALGLAFRKANAGAGEEGVLVGRSYAPRPPTGEPRRVTDDMTVIRSFNPGTEVGVEPATVPAGRFWLLTALVVLVTAALGYWTMVGSESLTKDGWDSFLKKVLSQRWPSNRLLAHMILGFSFLALSLICALLAWLAPRRRGALGMFGGLLVLVVAAQVWIGVLLTFDSGKGPLTRFRTAADKEALSNSAASSSNSDAGAATTLPSTPPAPATQPASSETPLPPADKSGDSK